MSDNPYSNDSGFSEYSEPERTSALAVTSLVMSLACCIPGLGLLGAGLGVGALLGISSSRGRVGGKGIATAGIIIGILITVAWISFASMVWSGVKEAAREVYTPVNEIMVDIDAGNYDAVRSAFGGGVLSSVSDGQIAAFRDAYQAELGSFVSIPTDPGGLLEAYLQVGPQMQGFQQPAGGQTVLIPIPATFDQSGPVVMFATMNASQQTGPSNTSGPLELFSNLRILMPDGTELDLLPTAPPAAPAAPSPAPGSDEDGDDDADDDDGP
jgi:hypothetical protein